MFNRCQFFCMEDLLILLTLHGRQPTTLHLTQARYQLHKALAIDQLDILHFLTIFQYSGVLLR